MTLSQQTPIFCDVARPYFYPVKQSATQSFVQVTTPGGSQLGSITFKPGCYFVVFGITSFTNYDNVAPVIATANSNAVLGRPSTPNNYTVKLQRGNSNTYSNLPIPQAQIASSGTRGGKQFPLPVVYGSRSEIQFTFQDTTGLFLLTATSAGSAVPLNIYMFLLGYNVPVQQWGKFCLLYPEFSNVFGAAPSFN